MTFQEMMEYEKAEARQEAREEGLAEGRAEGLEKGKAEAFAENVISAIRVCKNLGASDEQIITNLVKEFGISEEETKTYLNKM